MSKIDALKKVWEKSQSNPVKEPEILKLADYGDIPGFPVNMVQCSSEKLGKLYARYIAFIAFFNDKIMDHKIHLTRLKVAKRRRRSVVLYSSRGIKLQKQAAANADPEVAHLTDEIAAETVMLMANSNMMWTLRDYIKAIEFEVSRRHGEYRTTTKEAR